MNDVLLFDAVGRTIPLNASGRSVDLNGLAAGMYLLRATREGQVLSTRFQKL